VFLLLSLSLRRLISAVVALGTPVWRRRAPVEVVTRTGPGRRRRHVLVAAAAARLAA